MNTVFKGLVLCFSLFFVSNIVWAGCKCDGKYCYLSCISNIDTVVDISVKSKMKGNKCGANTGEMTLDEVCQKKGLKGVAPHAKGRKDLPALWCPDARCR